MPEEDSERLDAAFAAAGEITRTGTALDGAVTVEVAVGGRVLSVQLGRAALRVGAQRLADAVTEAAKQATVLANQAAASVYQRALGSRAEQYLTRLGLDAPEPVPRRGNRAVRETEDEDYPESWLS